MKVISQSVLSLVLGFIGGVLAMRIVPRLESPKLRPNITAGTVRAERFELVDASNSPLAYWEHDWKRGRVLIVFLDEKGQSRAEFGVESRGAFNANFAPYAALIGSDGRVRMQQRLDSSDSPVLAMGDAASENRLMLGHWTGSEVPDNKEDPWDKWSLVFRHPTHGWKDYVDIGTTTPLDTKQRTGYIVLRDSSGHVLRNFPK